MKLLRHIKTATISKTIRIGDKYWTLFQSDKILYIDVEGNLIILEYDDFKEGHIVQDADIEKLRCSSNQTST